MILKAAEGLFASRGYAETPIRDIARAAGVNSALIHYYFKNKDGLYRAILANAGSTVHSFLVEAVEGAESAQQRIDRFVRAYASYILGHPNLARILFREMITGGARLAELTTNYAQKNYSILRQTLTEGVRNGELRKLDVDLAPLSLLGMVIVFQVARPVISVVMNRTQYDENFIDRLSEHTVELFLKGAACPGASTKARKTAANRKHRGSRNRSRQQR
jgi:TetR/AcrR family transcriptional regulator